MLCADFYSEPDSSTRGVTLCGDFYNVPDDVCRGVISDFYWEPNVLFRGVPLARPKKVLTANIHVQFGSVRVCTTDLAAAVVDESTFPMEAQIKSLKSTLEDELKATVVSFFSDNGLEVAVEEKLAEHSRLTVKTEESFVIDVPGFFGDFYMEPDEMKSLVLPSVPSNYSDNPFRVLLDNDNDKYSDGLEVSADAACLCVESHSIIASSFPRIHSNRRRAFKRQLAASNRRITPQKVPRATRGPRAKR